MDGKTYTVPAAMWFDMSLHLFGIRHHGVGGARSLK
ncbi:MAG: hypothetical protein RLZZ156_1837, partial [Deinococcota bacterium]